MDTNKRDSLLSHIVMHLLLVTSLYCKSTNAVCVFGERSDCMFPCRCESDSGCDSTNGQCFPGTCKIDQSSKNGASTSWTWHGPGCQIGNIALNKKAISNDGSSMFGNWMSDNKMTNGITRASTRTCPYITTNQAVPAAWLIDLEKPHKIESFLLYVYSKNVGKIRATVGNTTALSEHVTCSVLKTSRGIKRKKLEVKLNCSELIVGRYVAIVKDPELDDQIDSLVLCEIGVIGHIHYNIHRNACMDSDFNEIFCTQCLDSLTPDCVKPCPRGRYGLNCQLSCEPCSGSCNPVTGKCDDDHDGVTINNGNNPDEYEGITRVSPVNKGTTTPKTLIDKVVFVPQQEDIIRGVTLGFEVDGTTKSSKSKSSKPATSVPVTTIIKNNKDKCDFGYFGRTCALKCGSCLGGVSCDSQYGTCGKGCEEWYVNGEYHCDTLIPRIDLTIENVVVYPTPYALKLKLYGVTQVHDKIEAFYKGEIRAKLKKDTENPEYNETDMLTFYPENGSFMKELSLSGLQENSEYEISIVIFRVHNGHSSAGAGVTLTASTSVAKASSKKVERFDFFSNNITFILLVVGFGMLLLIVTGVILVLCIRAKRRKDGSSISDSDTNSNGPVSLTKMEQDPIYQFIDDGGDLKYHVYNDIDELAKNRMYPMWHDAPKLSKDDFTGSVHLISRPPFTRQSYTLPEISELEQLRRRENLSASDLALVNNGYLTTAAVKSMIPEGSWRFSQPQDNAPTVPRYVKSYHGNDCNRLSFQDRASKPECDYLLPLSSYQQQQQQHKNERNNQINAGFQQQQQHKQEVLPDYMVPVNQRRHQHHTGYIQMDANTNSSVQAAPQRRGYFSSVNNIPNNNMGVHQGGSSTSLQNDSVNRHQPSYVDMA